MKHTNDTRSGVRSIENFIYFFCRKDWSPECVRIPTGPPAEWGIEEVIQYITATDPALKVYADLFRSHVC